MPTDGNLCGFCDWEEWSNEDSFNPRRRKCPECGAEFAHREEIRWFS